MLKNKTSIIDERGYNQGFRETPALVRRMERRAQWLIEEMQVRPDKKVLEIGCGTGFLSWYIAQQTGMKVLGSDLSPLFIENASQRFWLPNLSYEVLDFNEAAKNIDNKFDYIVGNGILHHLYYHLGQALHTMRELLSPEGKLVFMEPNVYNPYIAVIFKNRALRKWARLEPDEMAFSRKYIGDMLKKQGYRDINVRYKDFLLPGIPGFLIQPSIVIGNIVERTPLKIVSQSILISATK